MRPLVGVETLLWRLAYRLGGPYALAGKGVLFPLLDDGEESPLAVGDDGQVLTADSAADNGVSWQDPTGGSGGVDPSAVSALRSLMAFLAPLLSPRFVGTPTKNGVALATTADIPAAADPSSDQFILASQIFGA